MTHSANLGSASIKDTAVLGGIGPHHIVARTVKALLGILAAGLLVALDAAGKIVPFDVEQSADLAAGDGAATSFALDFGGPLVPGSVGVTDGTEAFTDDGFGTLTGDATGTGKINYQTGQASVTFNAAPADEQAITATYKPALYGVLEGRADATDGEVGCSVVRFGEVRLGALSVNGSDPDQADLDELDNMGLWPV